MNQPVTGMCGYHTTVVDPTTALALARLHTRTNDAGATVALVDNPNRKLALHGEIDVAQRDALRHVLTVAIGCCDSDRLTIDLSGPEFADGGASAVLAQTIEVAARHDMENSGVPE